MTTKFIHIRDYQEKNIYSPAATGGMTIAYKVDVSPERFVISYGVANCHDADNYCKKTGRQLAESRLDKDPYYIAFPNTKGTTKVLNVEHLLRNYLS